MVWYGMVWYGIVWYGMVWYGMVWCGTCSWLVHPNNQDIMWGMPQQIGDCCGFVPCRTHWMVDALVSKHGTWDFNYPEVLGIGPADTGSHWMSFIHFQTSAYDRAGLRGIQGKQHRAERAKTKGLRKRERQRAALAEAKALATTSTKARNTP